MQKGKRGICMKKLYRKPEVEIEGFVPNEYVAACEGRLEDGEWIIFGDNVHKETAYHRTPAGIGDYTQDDILDNPRTIYMGSFYRKDGTEIQPDATGGGHEFIEDFGENPCVEGNKSKSPWGYHYHFIEVANNS